LVIGDCSEAILEALMASSKYTFAIVTTWTLFAVGCQATAPESTEEDVVGTAEQAIVWGNGTDPGFFWLPSTQQELRALSQAPLRTLTGDMVATSLTATAEGRELLDHLVGCALPKGTALRSAAAGASFAGMAGLAPEWASAPLGSSSSRRWMTACLLQTLNGLDAHVPIHLSGRHPALADGASDDVSEYTVPDATMFGDLFHPDGPAAFACLDDALMTSCDVGFSAYALQRFCDASPSCGVTLLGPCSASCELDSAGHPTCEDPAGHVYSQAIFSTLKQTVCINPPPVQP
jgi:hypothetical protein